MLRIVHVRFAQFGRFRRGFTLTRTHTHTTVFGLLVGGEVGSQSQRRMCTPPPAQPLADALYSALSKANQNEDVGFTSLKILYW